MPFAKRTLSQIPTRTATLINALRYLRNMSLAYVHADLGASDGGPLSGEGRILAILFGITAEEVTQYKVAAFSVPEPIQELEVNGKLFTRAQVIQYLQDPVLFDTADVVSLAASFAITDDEVCAPLMAGDIDSDICMETLHRALAIFGLQAMFRESHRNALEGGWWNDLATGQPKDRNVPEMIALQHSELSEALEGNRKGLMDDKLPHRRMDEVEWADAIIRIADCAEGLDLDVPGAIMEKMAFNRSRPDHKVESRLAEGGKAF